MWHLYSRARRLARYSSQTNSPTSIINRQPSVIINWIISFPNTIEHYDSSLFLRDAAYPVNRSSTSTKSINSFEVLHIVWLSSARFYPGIVGQSPLNAKHRDSRDYHRLPSSLVQLLLYTLLVVFFGYIPDGTDHCQKEYRELAHHWDIIRSFDWHVEAKYGAWILD